VEIVQQHRRGMREKIAQRDSSGNLPVHVALVIWAIVAVSLEHWFSGWGVPIGIGGLVVGLAIRAGRRLWHEVWFWATVAIMAALQVPLMLHVQPYMTRLKLLFIFPFAVVDFLVFGIVVQCVALLCSRDPALH
jgi:hypothetical protein